MNRPLGDEIAAPEPAEAIAEIPHRPLTAAAFPASRVGWHAVIICLILYVLSLLDRSILQLMIEPVRAALHLKDFQISLLVGIAFAATYALAGLPLGYAADKTARRKIIAFGVALWGAATICCGLSGNFWQLFGARIGVGIGEAALVPASHSIISDLFPPEKRTFPLTVFQVGSVVGGGVSLAIGGVLIAAVAHVDHLPIIGQVQPWQVVFFIIGLPSVLAALLIFTIPEPIRRTLPRRATTGKDFFRVFRFIGTNRRFFIAHFGGFALLSALQYGAAGWMPTYLRRTFGWTMPQAGGALAVLIIGTGLAGSFGAAAFVQWMYRRGSKDAHLRYQMWVSLVAATVGAAAFLAPHAWQFFAMITVCNIIGLMPITALGAASLQMIAPGDLRGQLSALYLCTVNMVGGGLGPVIVASITDFIYKDDAKISYSLATTFVVIAPIASLLLWSGLKAMRVLTSRRLEEIGAAAA